MRSKAALIGVWGSPALPLTKKGRAKEKITKIHQIFTLQIFGATIVFGVFPLFLPLAITVFGGPEVSFRLAIMVFEAFGSMVPKYYYRLGKMDKKSLQGRA